MQSMLHDACHQKTRNWNQQKILEIGDLYIESMMYSCINKDSIYLAFGLLNLGFCLVLLSNSTSLVARHHLSLPSQSCQPQARARHFNLVCNVGRVRCVLVVSPRICHADRCVIVKNRDLPSSSIYNYNVSGFGMLAKARLNTSRGRLSFCFTSNGKGLAISQQGTR